MKMQSTKFHYTKIKKNKYYQRKTISGYVLCKMYILHFFTIVNFYSKVGRNKEIYMERKGRGNIEIMRKRGKDRENEIERM